MPRPLLLAVAVCLLGTDPVSASLGTTKEVAWRAEATRLLETRQLEPALIGDMPARATPVTSCDRRCGRACVVVPGRFVITREQHFEPFHEAANEARGRYSAQIPAPVDVTGDYVLADTERGSRMRMETVCKARVPIIGGQIEQLLMSGLKTLFSKEGEFTADWVARHL
jgi:hypothetical protein